MTQRTWAYLCKLVQEMDKTYMVKQYPGGQSLMILLDHSQEQIIKYLDIYNE